MEVLVRWISSHWALEAPAKFQVTGQLSNRQFSRKSPLTQCEWYSEYETIVEDCPRWLSLRFKPLEKSPTIDKTLSPSPRGVVHQLRTLTVNERSFSLGKS